jgi:transcriptional regulator GlxA family with amidase domain
VLVLAFEDLADTCEIVAEQMRDAATYARRGDEKATYALIASAIELLRGESASAGQRKSLPVPVGSKVSVRASLPAWRVRLIVEHIESNLGERIQIQELARIAGVSKGHFFHVFKRCFGVTVGNYVTARRMQLARRYLLTTSDSLAEIALRCGMTDQPHFTKIFRRVFGQPPARWRRARMTGRSPAQSPAGACESDSAGRRRKSRRG